ncbi:hypothetical protein SSBR45G_17160 [Bradyrhizobium sp. SSBR45G]|uniref:hypothetical protein n=1 Tax=unclassified Bradyrhizobium TaxID=2631580 RepID=UPI002342966A|nr:MULTISPECIES: hypothetical protein [unclassified Bradyrhizobium]GLH76808.1 hypothetical protein SSBR45G_17160 [Bradyrhizobium sp. SSBR45G]GLH83566.1 hypothetical protein SSBR45R_10260 [Bradyrhizobium sp. SSBR45R]
MSEHSSTSVYVNWARERLHEMDAALESFGVKAAEAEAASKAKAQEIFADLQKRRDDLEALLKTQAEAGGATLASAKSELDQHWAGFEAQMKAYFDTIGQQAEQQKTTFKDIAAAQAKAWTESADRFRAAATQVTTTGTADLDAVFTQLKSDAAQAGAHLEQLKQAGSASWSVFSAALGESRKAFDAANQAAWNALTKSSPKG